MNTPPGQYNASPPQQNSEGGCLKAVGITCGVLLLLAVIGVVLISIAVKKQISNPHGLLGESMKVGQATADGFKIQRAIVQYHTDSGSYPASLTVLTPKYIQASKLHSDVDTNPDPTHVSWKYTKPDATSTGKSQLLSLPYTVTLDIAGQSKSISSDIVIDLDGSTGAPPGAYERTPASGSI